MKNNGRSRSRLVTKCSCGAVVSSESAEGRGGVKVRSGLCWKCEARFKYDAAVKGSMEGKYIGGGT